MIVSNEQVEEALEFLGETDEQAGLAKALVERTDYDRKHLRAKLIAELMSRKKMSAAAAGNIAEASEEYLDSTQAHTTAVQNYESLRNKRFTKALVLDVWRTVSANTRQGAGALDFPTFG